MLLVNCIVSCFLKLKKLCYIMKYLLLVWYTYRVIFINFASSIYSSDWGIFLIILNWLDIPVSLPVSIFWTLRFLLWVVNISSSFFLDFLAASSFCCPDYFLFLSVFIRICPSDVWRNLFAKSLQKIASVFLDLFQFS